MPHWTDRHNRTLRHLAAARFFLPEILVVGDFPDIERHYLEFLHHSELGLALEMLEEIGRLNTGFAEETLFWQELALAAESMDLNEQAETLRRYAAERGR